MYIYTFFFNDNGNSGSPGVMTLCFTAGTGVRSMVWEPGPHKLHHMVKFLKAKSKDDIQY